MNSQNRRGTTGSVRPYMLGPRLVFTPLLARSAAPRRPRSETLGPPCLAIHFAADSVCRPGRLAHTAHAPSRASHRPTPKHDHDRPAEPVILAAILTPETSRTHGRGSSRRSGDRSAGFREAIC